jgi:hypothetical protein
MSREPAKGVEETRTPQSDKDVLTELLESIAEDPTAGDWSRWARKLLAGDDQAGGALSTLKPTPKKHRNWRPPRKPR